MKPEDGFLYYDEGQGHLTRPGMPADRMRIRYKATIQDGKTTIEYQSADHYIKHGFNWWESRQVQSHTWYDMGNGAHISSESLDRITRPYDFKTEAELEHETEPYT